MSWFKKIISIQEEVQKNPNVGTFSWLLHRITGIALTLYLFPHFWVIGSSIAGKESFNERLASVQTSLFHVLEMGLIAVVFFHMLNGIRIVLVDFLPVTRRHREILGIVMFIFVVIMGYTIFLFIPRIFER